jgi:hypothetical protein
MKREDLDNTMFTYVVKVAIIIDQFPIHSTSSHANEKNFPGHIHNH